MSKIGPIKINDLKDLKRELYKCFKCNCETFPICMELGGSCELCTECFDIEKFTHKQVCTSKPGKFQTSTEKPKLIHVKNPRIKNIRMPSDGDCLYNAFVTALENGVTVEDLRYLVSRKQSPESFRAYKTLADWKMAEFNAIKSAKTLREFKNVIQHPGSKVGATHCVWGDENAMRIISNTFYIGVLIFNEKGTLIQTIKPEFKNAKRFILLQLNSRIPDNEHYDLLVFNNNKLITYNELSELKSILNSR